MPPKPQYTQAVASSQKKQPEQESGWTKSTAMQKQQEAASKKSLDFNHATGKVATTVSEAAENLRNFIIKAVHDNNVLGLPEDEIKNVAKLLMQTPNKTEILDWTQTLMQPNSFAEEIIRQRDIAASRFAAQNNEQDSDEDGAASTAATTTASTTASSATARKKGGKGARGKTVSLGKGGAAGDGHDVLVEGQHFECGCYAASHAFRSNCANCGRIFCMQESDEVCYSCQLPPQSCLALELKQALGKISDAADRKDRQGLEVALERRDKLLAFARERSKRTTVIDDQSGNSRATALSATDPWSTRAEREKAAAAGEDERRRVAEMHRRTGAVAVHLDIVNSCVQLGATPLTKEKQEEEGDDSDSASKKKETVEMGLGFAGTAARKDPEAERKEQANVCAGISSSQSKNVSLKKLARPNEDGEGDNDNNNEDDDDFFIDDNNNNDDDEGARRVVALPSLMSQIFYCKTDEEAEEKTKIKATLKQSQNAGNLVVGRPAKHTTIPTTPSATNQQQQQHQPRKVDFRRPEDTKDSVSGRAIRVNDNNSRRVQVDYFEGDNDTWLMAEQQDELFDEEKKKKTLTSSSSSIAVVSNRKQNNKNNANDDEEENSDDDVDERNDYNDNIGGGAIRAYQRNENNRNDAMIENERLLHITIEDASRWKDNTTRVKPNASKNDNDDDGDDDNRSPVSLVAIDNSLLLLQQKAKKLFHKDEGWCLSMHQPWASLLIAGIKTHEGRTWPTEWRGRLWIHAAAAKPQQDTINEVEAHARQFVPADTAFPTSYPTKCLLGCVALADCLDRDRYETTFAPGEQQLGEGSTHCFLCMLPKALPFPLAMDGQHKIYKLDKKHWHAARKLFKEPLI